AEGEELLGDLLAAERLLLDHLEVLADDLLLLGVGRPLAEQVVEAAFEGLAAKGDAGERVVDLVGDAGGEEADAGEALGADQLPAALVDLLGEAGVHFAQA